MQCLTRVPGLITTNMADPVSLKENGPLLIFIDGKLNYRRFPFQMLRFNCESPSIIPQMWFTRNSCWKDQNLPLFFKNCRPNIFRFKNNFLFLRWQSLNLRANTLCSISKKHPVNCDSLIGILISSHFPKSKDFQWRTKTTTLLFKLIKPYHNYVFNANYWVWSDWYELSNLLHHFLDVIFHNFADFI